MMIKGAARFLVKAVAVLGMVVSAGCATSGSHPYADKSLKGAEGLKMAILPFDNLSKTQGAGKSMENVILTEFLKAAPVKIVDPGEVAAVLSQERVRLATSISRETIKTVGKKLGVNFIMVGIVHEYEMELASGAGGSGQIPLVSITLRIIDAATADIVWASNATLRGNDRESIFGIGRVSSLSKLADITGRELAQSFAGSLRK